MSTGAYQADTVQLITRPHAQVVRASLTHPAYGVLDLQLGEDAQATVVFDEARAPRVEAGLTVPLLEYFAPVDPRAGWRLQVDAGYVRADGTEDVDQLCDLFVRKTPRDHQAATLGIAATSDESLVIDAAPAVAEKVTAASPAAAMADLLGKAIRPTPYVQDPLTATGAVTIDPVEDRWAALQDLADRYGVQVYDDGTRVWHALPQPVYTASTPVHTLTVGQGGTVLAPSEDVDRDAWSNYVLLRYRWRTAAGADAQVVATAYVADGDYAITGPAGRRIFRDDREVSTSQATANAVAANILTRQLSRAETMTVRAIAAYWLRPGDTIDVVLADGKARRVLVSRVAFDLMDGTMTVTTRRPPVLDYTIATTTPPPDPATPTTPKPPVADPVPTPKVAYVTEWAATATASYRSNGTKRTDVDAGDLWQGTFSGSYNGNQRGLAMFTTSTGLAVTRRRSEVGKTIDQALAGVDPSDVSRVELMATLEHSWGPSADVLLGYYDGTNLPSTAPKVSPYVTSSSWPQGSARIVNVTRPALVRDLVDGSARVFTFGPGLSSDTRYYARLSNVRIRIHYAK